MLNNACRRIILNSMSDMVAPLRGTRDEREATARDGREREKREEKEI